MTPQSNHAIVAELRELLDKYDNARIMGDAEQQANAAKILDPLYEDPIKYVEACVAVIEELEENLDAKS